MTKKEIVKTISEEMQLTQLKTKEIVQKTFDAIVETLVTEGRIELRNFGVFEVKKRAARKARNPRTGDRVDVKEKYVVTFKPGKEMEERVRQMEEAEAAGHALPPRNPSQFTSFDDDEEMATGVEPGGLTRPVEASPVVRETDRREFHAEVEQRDNGYGGTSHPTDPSSTNVSRPWESSYVPGRTE